MKLLYRTLKRIIQHRREMESLISLASLTGQQPLALKAGYAVFYLHRADLDF